jgi:hypothetical protein
MTSRKPRQPKKLKLSNDEIDHIMMEYWHDVEEAEYMYRKADVSVRPEEDIMRDICRIMGVHERDVAMLVHMRWRKEMGWDPLG